MNQLKVIQSRDKVIFPEVQKLLKTGLLSGMNAILAVDLIELPGRL
jgi:hypothetical protein